MKFNTIFFCSDSIIIYLAIALQNKELIFLLSFPWKWVKRCSHDTDMNTDAVAGAVEAMSEVVDYLTD
jgi:hypothetical protein